MAEKIKIRFWDGTRLVVQQRSKWSVLRWPTGAELHSGEGEIFEEPGGERALILNGNQLSWLGGRPFSGDPSLDVTRVAWDGTGNIIFAGKPPRSQGSSQRLEQVFGARPPDALGIWRLGVDGSRELVFELEPGQTVGPITPLDQGIVLECRKGPWNNADLSWRFTLLGRDGEEATELLPEVSGLQTALTPSPQAEQIALLNSDPPFPYWWRILLSNSGRTTAPLPEDLIVGTPVWRSDGEVLGATASEGIRVGAIIFRPEGDFTWIVPPDGHCYCVAFSPEGDVVFVWQGLEPGISLYRLDSTERVLVCELEPPSSRRTTRQLVKWSSTGVELEGLLEVPPSGEAPWPTIVDLHGGPDYSMSLALPNNMVPFELWTERGFAVFAPDFRGSGIAGRDAKLIANHFIASDDGGSEWTDVTSGVDALVSRGVCDPDRLFLFGFSHGGWLACRLLAEDGRFEAAATWEAYGIDLKTEYGMLGGNPMTRALFGGSPWEVPESYERASLITYVDRLRTPLLAMRGDPDTFGAFSARVLYTALKERGIDTELVFYPGQVHAVEDPHFLKQIVERCVRWFDAHGPRSMRES